MCGLFAVTRLKKSRHRKSLLGDLFRGLGNVAHRGHHGYGVSASFYDPTHQKFDFKTERDDKDFGKAAQNGSAQALIDQLPPDTNQVLGHIRYVTSGGHGTLRGQPMRSHGKPPPKRQKVMIFNGNIVNDATLREELKAKGYTFYTETDTEVLMRLIDSLDTEEQTDYAKIFREVAKKIDGGCSIILMDDHGDMVGFRHNNGLRPLVGMKTDDGELILTSETKALAPYSGAIFPVPNGQIVWYRNSEDDYALQNIAEVTPDDLRLCALEILYFQKPESENFGLSNSAIRRQIGAQYAAQIENELQGMSAADRRDVIITPVPNTANAYAEGLHEALGHNAPPLVHAVQATTSTRSFISEESEREEILSGKHQVDPESVRGKIVYLVDDTLIAGNTTQDIAKKMLAAGAKEIRFLIASPPILGTDYYGMVLPEEEGLAYWQAYARLTPAEKRTFGTLTESQQNNLIGQQIAKDLDAAIGASGKMKISVSFLTLEQLKHGMPAGHAEQINYACFTGQYPTPCGQTRHNEAVRRLQIY